MNSFWSKTKSFFAQEKVILFIYVLAGFVIALQHYLHGSYNNYKIFKASTAHLLARQNLHVEYPNEYFDLFLYHPTFAVLFAPFAWMPMWVGMCVWNIFSALTVFYAIKFLPISAKQKNFMWWFIFVELMTALHNLQTNPLIAALIVWTFVNLENQKTVATGFVSSLGFFIKGYGGISAALLPFYRKDFFKNVFVYILFFGILAILPAFVVGFDQLPRLYSEWQTLLVEDHKVNYGVSIIGLICTLITTSIPIIYIQLVGLICLGLFLAYGFFLVKNQDVTLRISVVAYLMMWVILFNHAAESNTHVISIVGVAFWYLISPKNKLTKALVIFVFILTILSPTDVFPKFIRDKYVIPYNLKALPVLLVWLHLQYLVFTQKYQPLHEQND